MNRLIGIAGDVAAVVGILVCILSGAARAVGVYSIGDIGTIAMFTAGVGIMVFACLAKLQVLTAQLRSR